MIPHHSGAILMCEQAAITDPEIVALCGDIVKAQRDEIAQMKAILARYSSSGARSAMFAAMSLDCAIAQPPR